MRVASSAGRAGYVSKIFYVFLQVVNYVLPSQHWLSTPERPPFPFCYVRPPAGPGFTTASGAPASAGPASAASTAPTFDAPASAAPGWPGAARGLMLVTWVSGALFQAVK